MLQLKDFRRVFCCNLRRPVHSADPSNLHVGRSSLQALGLWAGVYDGRFSERMSIGGASSEPRRRRVLRSQLRHELFRSCLLRPQPRPQRTAWTERVGRVVSVHRHRRRPHSYTRRTRIDRGSSCGTAACEGVAIRCGYGFQAYERAILSRSVAATRATCRATALVSHRPTRLRESSATDTTSTIPGSIH